MVMVTRLEHLLAGVRWESKLEMGVEVGDEGWNNGISV
jgi:hypothetical protein